MAQGPEELNYYILFRDYTEGLALQELLKGEGLQARIAPTPRVFEGAKPCGMSLLVKQDQIEAVRESIARNGAAYVDIVELPCQIRPDRDRYC